MSVASFLVFLRELKRPPRSGGLRFLAGVVCGAALAPRACAGPRDRGHDDENDERDKGHREER